MQKNPLSRLKIPAVLLLGALALAPLPSGSHRVKAVFDGDTIQVETGEKVRYLGIDAPEMDPEGGRHEFMAREASDCNRDILKNGGVRLEYDKEKRDPYGRLLAYVFLDTGEMVNVLLVRKGMARVLLKKPNLRYKDLLVESQRTAIRDKRGIWSAKPKDDEPFYVGSAGSFRLHRPACPSAKEVSPRNRVTFRSTLEAYMEGYSPCRRCRP